MYEISQYSSCLVKVPYFSIKKSYIYIMVQSLPAKIEKKYIVIFIYTFMLLLRTI